MTVRILSNAKTRLGWSMVVIALMIGFAANAEACSCLGPVPTSALLDSAAVAFIGKVQAIQYAENKSTSSSTVNPDGTITTVVTFSSFSFGSQVRFSVERMFKGENRAEVMISRGGTTCDYPFVLNASYLVFATSGNGIFAAEKCHRPLPLPQAAEALKYLEGRQANRPQALLYGLALRRGVDATGKAVLMAPRERFVVHLEGPGLSFETQTNEADEFELTVPPGEYRVRLRRNGETAGEIQTLKLTAGDVKRHTAFAFPLPIGLSPVAPTGR